MKRIPELVRPPGRWIVFLVAFLAIFAMGGIWGFATPLMGAPDEPAHVIRAAAVVRGDFIPRQSTTDPYMSEVDVPQWAAKAHALTCFAYDPGISAACQHAPEDDDEIVVAPTSAGSNSPLYYAIVGLPSLILDGAPAFYAMRLVNAALTASLLAATFMSVSQLARRMWSYLAIAVAITPMAMFLTGAVNPNSIEFASAGALFGTLLTLVRTPSSKALLWERAALVVASALFLVNTRSISMLWLIIIVVLAFIAAKRDVLAALFRRPVTWAALTSSGLVSLLALFWFTRPQPEIVTENAPVYPLIGGNFILGAQVMLDRTLEFASGWVGLFGWIDTPPPSFALLIWCTAIVGLTGAALLFGRGRARLASVLLLVVAIAIPIVVQGILLPDYGIIWQGRYMMAVYLCLMIAVGVTLDDAPVSLSAYASRRIILLVIFGIGVGQVVAFLWVLRRYVVGGGTWVQMLLQPAWQPPLTWIGLATLFTAAVAASALALGRITARVDVPAEFPAKSG